jgi:hypothetical protein
MTMHNGNVWELAFDQPAVLELQAEFGNLSLVPVEPGQSPRLELSRSSGDNVDVHVEKVDEVVRVTLDPRRGFNNWFAGGWDCRAVLYVPRDVHAALQTNAGSVSVRGLDGCELGIKANAGKIDLVDVYGLMHLAADAGSITGRALGGFFDVQTQAGSVKLEILDLQPGEHRFRASMGSVRLDLARGMDVCIETRTSLGSVRNNYPVRPEAPRRLLLSTEMGSVRVDEGPPMRSARRSASPRPPGSSSSSPDASATDGPSPSASDEAQAETLRPASASRSAREDPELERILKMVEAGELSARDAEELLQAMGRV